MDREGERAQAGVGADVGSRLLAADMLLARTECQHEAAFAVGIDGLADQPPWHLAHVLLFGGEQPDVRAAEAQAVAD